MLKIKFRDIKRRKKFFEYELKGRLLSSVCKNVTVFWKIRFLFRTILSNNYYSYVVCRNICYITSRTKSVFSFFGLERFLLRSHGILGKLPYLRCHLHY